MIAEIIINGIRKVRGADGKDYAVKFWVDGQGRLTILQVMKIRVSRDKYGIEIITEETLIGEIKIG